MQKGIITAFVLAVICVLAVSGEASDVDIEKEVQENLYKSSALVDRAAVKIKSGELISSEIQQLKALSENIQAAHLLLQERFRLRQDTVNQLGGKALERQSVMEARYLKALGDYLALIESLPSARASSQIQTIETQQTLQTLKTLLDKILPKSKRPIFGSIPYRNLNYPAREPDTSPAIKPAYKGGNKTVSPDDTKSTEEAPISMEIATLAQSLNWNPVSIYEYVKNNIETEWYWGCMKGAEETLRQKSGNDCDQATLLAALLRASGFPTRYVRGTIEFFAGGRDGIPMEKIKNLTGVDDTLKIAEFFQKAGIPYKPVIQGGKITNFQIEHIWVESRIPYGNYRGAMIDNSDPIWLGLDTSIKPKGYTYNTSTDILSHPELISGSLSAIRDEYLATLQAQTPLEYIQTYINSELRTQNSGLTYNDLLRTKTLVPEIMKILPASMQFDQKKITHEYTQIPDELKHKVKLSAFSGQPSANNNQLFEITLDAMSLSNQQIAITYEPETVEDQEIINSYGGLDNTPAYLVRLRPVLKVNEERVVVGKDGLPMGADHTLTIELISPNGTERITNTHITGNLSVIGIVAQKTIPSPLAGEGAGEGDKDAEQLLYEEAINYIERWNQAEDELASLLHLNLTRPIPTVVTVGGVIDVTYLLDMPHGFEWKGVYIDASKRAIEVTPSHSPLTQGGEAERKKTFMQLSGLQGSILENRIFEDDFQVESISTAKLMQVVSSQQSAPSGQLLTIDKTNIVALLSASDLADNIKEDIINAVNQGFIVRIPSADGLPLTAISYIDWAGTGYIKENQITGEAGYMLSGMLASSSPDLSGIAGGMTAITPEEWVEYWLVSTLKAPYTEEPSKGPAATIVKVLPTDRQSGVVGTQLGQQLMVLVQDRLGVPVEGAIVTFRVIAGGGNFRNILQQPQTTLEVKTGKDGVAKTRFFLGTKTTDNPMYKRLAAEDEFVTQIGLNLVTAITGTVVIQQPFSAYGVPDVPSEIKKIYGDSVAGLANNPAGSLVTKVVDKYGNPISNQLIRMKTVSIQPRYAGTVLPQQPRGVEFYDKQTCANAYPLYGDCPSKAEVILTTEYYGAISSAFFGDTVATKYSVEAAAVNSINPNLLPTYFEFYTTGFRAADNYIPPGVYLRYLQPVNDNGQPINASKAGTPLKAPLITEFIHMRDDIKLEGPAPCSSGEGTCWNLTSTGKVITEKITNGTVNFAAVSGGGTASQTENLSNGKYKATYTTGPQPAVNLVEAGGTATISVPKVLYNPMVTGTVIPSFGADYSGTTKPLAITEYRDTSLQCSNGTCKLPEASVTLKGGQQVIFYGAEPPQAAGTEQKATYTVYGVDVTLSMEPKVQFLNDKGYSYVDAKIKYTILPPEYNAAIVDIDLYKDGAWQGYLVGGMTQGTDSATIAAGSMLDVNSAYTAQAVLNKGSDMEITSSEIALPIGQFRIVADDDGVTPMEGAVTDGAARLRLHLIAKNNRDAFAGLAWSLIDPQVMDFTPVSIRGGFVAGQNIVDSLSVVFNADGVAEAIYRAPESFVRWDTPYASGDKELPERVIQPTVDFANYFKTQKDPLPPIRLKRPPVVLVHGLWGSGNRKSRNYSWKEFESMLNEKGLYDIVSVDYSETHADSFAINARVIKYLGIDEALSLIKERQFAATKVDIIGNSMGGLLPREYCRNNAGECSRGIRRLITTDSPHKGSELADILATYLKHRELMDNPISLLPPFTCFGAIDAFIAGAYDIAGVSLYRGDMHPIDRGAIDDLATGRWTEYPFNLVVRGPWKDFPELSSQFVSHAIVGVATQPEGHHKEIQKLFSKVLYRCNFTLERIFGDQANTNDRIVSQTSQRDNIAQPNTIIEGVDHYSVSDDTRVINRVKELLDLPNSSSELTKGK